MRTLPPTKRLQQCTHTPLDVSIQQQRAHGPVFSHQSMICIARVVCLEWQITSIEYDNRFVFFALVRSIKKIYSSNTNWSMRFFLGNNRTRGKTEENFERNGEKQTRFDLTLEWGCRCWTVAGNPALVFGVAMPMLMRLPPSLFGTTKALGISKAFVFIPWTYLTSCRSVTLQLTLNYVRVQNKVFNADKFSIHAA